MSDIVIRAEGLSKLYRIGVARQRNLTVRDGLANAVRRGLNFFRPKAGAGGNGHARKHEQFWALKDLSFEIKQGEAIGIIGPNGAGKSTLLKIISRIVEPTTGYMDVVGRVGSLLEVGTGFHPELTGRENILLNGSLLGMSQREIKAKFDEIVAFSEIDKFIDTPVKHYSSGMYVRLAFAVAAHLDPEIMIIDEVLAVGDAKFQKKCLRKMDEVVRGGRTVLLVSHHMGPINALCNKVIHLAKGQVQGIGPTREIVSDYLANLFENKSESLAQLRLPGEHGKLIRFRDIQLANADEAKLIFAQPVEFLLTVSSDIDLDELSIGASVFSTDGICIGSMITKEKFKVSAGQEIDLRLSVSDLMLAPGSYYAGFSIGYGGDGWGRRDFDAIVGKPAFQVLPISDDESDPVAHWNSSWGKVVFRATKLTSERSAAMSELVLK
jgi:lipopolysaccharide transport system ATP-binding protein